MSIALLILFGIFLILIYLHEEDEDNWGDYT